MGASKPPVSGRCPIDILSRSWVRVKIRVKVREAISFCLVYVQVVPWCSPGHPRVPRKYVFLQESMIVFFLYSKTRVFDEFPPRHGIVRCDLKPFSKAHLTGVALWRSQQICTRNLPGANYGMPNLSWFWYWDLKQIQNSKCILWNWPKNSSHYDKDSWFCHNLGSGLWNSIQTDLWDVT